jgi:hypothetical protein
MQMGATKAAATTLATMKAHTSVFQSRITIAFTSARDHTPTWPWPCRSPCAHWVEVSECATAQACGEVRRTAETRRECATTRKTA